MRLQKPVVATGWDADVVGYWRLFAFPRIRHAQPVEITSFRGAPTDIGEVSFADPFGARDMDFTLPRATVYDRIGEGDLWWCHKFSAVALVYYGPLPTGYAFGGAQMTGGSTDWWEPTHQIVPQFMWEGRLVSRGYTNKSLALTAKGALYSLDGYLAKPAYPPRPAPYEWAIRQAFAGHPLLGLRPMLISWPDWWTRTYTPPSKRTPAYLVPSHVKPGAKWTGMLTRQTGSFDPTLTGFVQALLSGMYTHHGRWTIDMLAGEQPLLCHRDMIYHPKPDTIVIDPADTDSPQLSLSEDWSQSINAVFGQGTSLAGSTFSGMNVTADGEFTSYEPLAAARQVHPEDVDNAWLDFSAGQRQEILLQLQEGLDELDAVTVAEAHLHRFGDPGVTGTAVLKHDPTLGGVPFPRHLVRAGMPVHLPYLLGRPEGVLAHVVENTISMRDKTNTITFDTRWRDALTVKEVRKRGRDAMQIPRMLVAGQYNPPIPDMLVPWDYTTGSGFIPSSSDQRGHELFDGMPDNIEFPWTEWTTQRPPSDTAWHDSYIRIGPTRANADRNWSRRVDEDKGGWKAIPIRMAQGGTIRLLQLAAYDRDGNVLPVSFHFSLYTGRGTTRDAMPKIPAGHAHRYRPYLPAQHYPFIKDAWSTYNSDGTQKRTEDQQAKASAGLVRGWGDFYERAGYSPGLMSARNPKTGLLRDEAPWPFDTTAGGGDASVFNQFSTDQSSFAGLLYAMIYCDDQGDQPVYFLGRMFRVEPGATT